MGDGKNYYARVPVRLAAKPGGSWAASAGDLEAEAGTQQAAIGELAEILASGAASALDVPSFWREDSGAVLVAVPDVFHGGCQVYRVTGDQASYMESSASDPDTAYSSAYGIRRIQEKF